MIGLAVLVPVKSSGAKSRLSGVLSEGERREFASLLLKDLLAALGRAGLLESTYVISSDRGALRMAESKGANGIPEPRDEGVNSAVSRGVRAVVSADTFMVLPADLPLVGPGDVKHVLALRSEGLSAVLVPSMAFNGTNALLYSPSDGLKLSYDDDSFWNHLRSAARKGIPCAVSSPRGIVFDVDSPDDFRALAESRASGSSAAFAREASK